MNRIMNLPPASVRQPLLLAECFILLNVGFLAVDIYVAHSMNQFAHWAEWIPFVFSLSAPVMLLLCMMVRRRIKPYVIGMPRVATRDKLATAVECLIGVGAIAVGVAGLLYHLESHFFDQQTLKSLVYTAPFVAPLAYTGIGLLILLNRTVLSSTSEWARWVLVLTLGGFVGNFILSLADHAQNGFFRVEEWIAVGASAAAVGALLVQIYFYRDGLFREFVLWIMIAQIAVSLLGWGYHVQAIMESPMETPWERVVYSAPVFAPLLFANLAILGVIGLIGLHEAQTSTATHDVVARQSTSVR